MTRAYAEAATEVAGRPLTVERVTAPAELPWLGAAWDELIDERKPSAVFRSSAWLVPWWNHFSHGKQLCVYTATADANLVGVLPAYHAMTRFGGRRLRFIGDGIGATDYLGVIASPGDLHAVSAAFARVLLVEEHELAFDDLAEDEPLLAELENQARYVGASLSCRPRVACPFLPINGGEFGDWLEGLPHRTRQELVRRRRWLHKQAGFRLEVRTDEKEVVAALPVLWTLHRAWWADRGGSSIAVAGRIERFHEESIRAICRRGWARLYVMSVGDQTVAALLGFQRGTRLAYYTSGSDPAWAHRSVMKVVLSAAIEDAFERDLTEFDFLRGEEPYKRQYTSSQRQLWEVRLASGMVGRALWALDEGQAAGRRMLKRILGTARTNWLRRRMRARAR